MARIQFNTDAVVEQVMSTVRETFEAREYSWEWTGAGSAVARESGTSTGDAALPLFRRLRITITMRPDTHRLVLSQENVGAVRTGAAAAAGAGPWLPPRLGARFRTIIKAVREDLTAAGWR